MSKLQDFLNKNNVENQEEEVVLSDRFKDEEGKTLSFKIRNISMQEYKQFQRTCTKTTKHGTDFDAVSFSEKVVIAGTVDPNFKNAESIKSLGCQLPEEYLYKVLKSGEVMTLASKILELSGFNTDMEELVEEAKN